ncbi:uncharacterized protein [Coffea arabica]|uniref:Uncharacterized protein isoform X3 n=1 Tax=Coffea arabica TaxID=13443 RepID=A0ABM4WY75_COFAR|nr:uncharacterized protein LOC113732597 isoform X2 [Coffea arabica]
MFPFFNHFPFEPNANANPPSAAQQVLGNNPRNFAPNPVQIQPQMGLINPQASIPFSNPSAHFGPNQIMNFPVAMNQMNNRSGSQSWPQIFGQNLNLGFPNQMHPDMNRIFQLQMSNFSAQAVPVNLSLAQNSAFIANTQPPDLNLSQNLAFVGNIRPAGIGLPQNIAFAANSQLGFVGSGGVVQQMANSNNGTHNATQQLQGISGSVQGFGRTPPSQNQTIFHSQPSKFQKHLQGDLKNGMGTCMMRKNGKSPLHKNCKRNSKHESPRNGFLKPKFDRMQNAKRNFNCPDMWLRRGNGNAGERHISAVNSSIQAQVNKKRPMSLTYSEKEIQDWREERKKNYPSKANTEKKLMEKLTKPEVSDKVAKLRRQQLKEILAKQAELGCEVAEIPSSYLSDSEQQVHESKESTRTFSKKRNFQNKFNKRGRFNQNDCFSKMEAVANHDSFNANNHNGRLVKQRLANDNLISHRSASKREPTLLRKLLGSEIRRDRHHLFQVFRFMVINSFFDDWPEKPLEFPVVMVKEIADEDELYEGNLVKERKDGSEGILGKTEESTSSDDLNDDNPTGKGKPTGLLEVVNSGQVTGCLGGGEAQEEEGEIID